MKIIASERGSGKTTRLIKISAETGDYIVCKNHDLARYTVDLAKKMGLEIPFPITFDEFLERKWYGKRISGFLIDDAELLLLKMLEEVSPIIHALSITTIGNVFRDRYEELP